MGTSRNCPIERSALAVLLAAAQAGGAFAAELSVRAENAAQLVRDALANPARVPRLDAALPVSLKSADGVVVPVVLDDFDASAQIDRAKIGAFVARAGKARGEKFVPSPVERAGDEVFDDWGLGYQFEPWTFIKPIPAQTRPEDAEDLIVRGRRAKPGDVERFMAATYGRNNSRAVLSAASRALAGVSAEDIRTMSAAQLHEAAARLFDDLPRGVASVRTKPRASYEDGPDRPDAYDHPSKDWTSVLQRTFREIEGVDRARLFAQRTELERRIAVLPTKRPAGAGSFFTDETLGPLAAALEERGLSAESFAALAPRERAGRLGRAFALADKWADEDARLAIAGARRKVMTVREAEKSAEELLRLLTGPFLGPGKRREAAAAYDEVQTLLYARQLRGLEDALGRIAPALGLQARRYSSRLGGVLVSGRAPAKGAAVPSPSAGMANNPPAPEDARRFSELADQSLNLFYSKSLARKAATFLARWQRAKRFHEPAVSDPGGLYADAAVLGMTGEREAVGLRGYSHTRVYEDARAIFRKYFGEVTGDPIAVFYFEQLLRKMYDEFPDHFPIKFAQSMAAHLRRAALLPGGEVADYLRDASPFSWDKDADDDFRAKEQDKILSDFTSVIHRALAQESGPARVVAVVLTGGFARLAARRNSDLDIQLITEDGETKGLEPFMKRVQGLWRETGHRNPIKPFPIALAPSLGLAQLVHKGPHVVIAADPSALNAPPSSARGRSIEEGVFEGEGDASLRERIFAMARESVEAARADAAEKVPTTSVIGYFPGLSSWEAYRGAGRDLWDSGLPEVRDAYTRASAALGLSGPESLFFTRENFPGDPAERAGFIAASFLTYNVALARLMERRSQDGRTPASFQAYGGDSLGMLTAAVASGAVSIEDGARVARFLLGAIKRSEQRPETRRRREIELGYWNVTDAGMEGLLDQAYKRFGRRFQNYRTLDWGRVKAYVDEDALADLKLWLKRRYPLAQVKEKGFATKTKGYHTAELSSVRSELARFLESSRIGIGAPSAPIVANNGAGLITTADGVRKALLAMVDEPMESKTTAKTMDELKPDAVVEIGLGDKGGALFRDNYLKTPTVSFTGQKARFDELQRLAARAGESLIKRRTMR